MRTVEQSLKRLRTDWIDLYQVHFPDPNVPIEETLRALDDLVRQGKVRQIGCSNFSAKQVEQAQAVSQQHGLPAFVTCQDEYSMLVRGIERDRIAVMQRYGMTLLPYAPLAGGFLTGKYQRGKPLPNNARLAYSTHHASDVLNERNWIAVEKIRAVAERAGLSMLELAFCWLLAQPITASVIAGASTPEQIELNVRAGQAKLSADVVAALDEITR
jgi:aryl-alcohol dehydrogenase-like predicted oxidoreductase